MPIIGRGPSIVDTETATGEIAEPTTSPAGDGHMVEVVYTDFTPDRVILWKYDAVNSAWYGVEMLG